MAGNIGNSDFNSSRAELFEALGHPLRIKILESIGEATLGFSELKKRVEIESSGHLQFHLSKLNGLVEITPEGNYKLTDDGKEALRILRTMKKAGEADIEHDSQKLDSKILDYLLINHRILSPRFSKLIFTDSPGTGFAPVSSSRTILANIYSFLHKAESISNNHVYCKLQ